MAETDDEKASAKLKELRAHVPFLLTIKENARKTGHTSKSQKIEKLIELLSSE